MYYQFFQFAHPLLMVALPVVIRSWSRRFYNGMTGFRLLVANSDCRLRQIRRIALALLLAHTSCQILIPNRCFGTLASLMLTLVLCKEELIHHTLLLFTKNTMFYLCAIASLILACSPNLLPLAMAMQVLLLAGWCYPTSKMIEVVRRPEIQSRMLLLHANDKDRHSFQKSQILHHLYLAYERE